MHFIALMIAVVVGVAAARRVPDVGSVKLESVLGNNLDADSTKTNISEYKNLTQTFAIKSDDVTRPQAKNTQYAIKAANDSESGLKVNSSAEISGAKTTVEANLEDNPQPTATRPPFTSKSPEQAVDRDNTETTLSVFVPTDGSFWGLYEGENTTTSDQHNHDGDDVTHDVKKTDDRININSTPVKNNEVIKTAGNKTVVPVKMELTDRVGISADDCPAGHVRTIAGCLEEV